VLDRLPYFLRRTLRNMRQSPFLTLATVATVTVALAILGFFGILVVNVQALTLHWSKDVQVVAYLDQLPPQDELNRWMTRIRGLEEVSGVNFVSREEAFDRFQDRLGTHADLLTGIDPEILPASLEIELKPQYRSQGSVQQVVETLRKNHPPFDLRYGQDWLERFESFVAILKLVGFILGGFLLFAALFIVSNTIRLTMYARREELEIMALVGATRRFIKLPFIIEGAFQGAAGGVLALALVYLTFALFLREGLRAVLLTPGEYDIAFLPGDYQLALIGMGLTLGLFGSLVSLRRFVRI